MADSGERQPGARASAPGELALVQAFLNSFYDLELHQGADLLATPVGLSGWLADQGFGHGASISGAHVRRAVEAREALRALARDGLDAARAPATLKRLNAALGDSPIVVRFGVDGPHHEPVGATALDRALGAVAARTAAAMVDGRFARLKICPGEECGWAFYDHSRNQSGRWCSMRVCGGRAKARAHYHRRRGEDGRP